MQCTVNIMLLYKQCFSHPITAFTFTIPFWPIPTSTSQLAAAYPLSPLLLPTSVQQSVRLSALLPTRDYDFQGELLFMVNYPCSKDGIFSLCDILGKILQTIDIQIQYHYFYPGENLFRRLWGGDRGPCRRSRLRAGLRCVGEFQTRPCISPPPSPPQPRQKQNACGITSYQREGLCSHSHPRRVAVGVSCCALNRKSGESNTLYTS